MIYMQQSDSCSNGRGGKKIKAFREKLVSTVSDKHQTTLTKMGAILATGLIDAGGRNCSLDLGSKNGFTKMTSAVGTVLWLQHWYWFPMMHMLSLAITPTFTIGLNRDFKYPKNFEITCNAKPSYFAYPKKLEEKKEEEKSSVVDVKLSKEDEEGGAKSMDIDGDTKVGDTKVEEKVDENETGRTKNKREPEPTTFCLPNPCRITKAQAEVCAFDQYQRYRPIHHEEKPCGVIMVTDSTPGEEEDLGTVKAPSIESEDEADPPEPFEWTPPGHPDAQKSS